MSPKHSKKLEPNLQDERHEFFTESADVRTFSTGATRSPLGNKLQYEGYNNPMVDRRYAEYMKKHQVQSDGTHRAPDNWQKGIDKDSLADSGYRHVMDWRLHHRGYPALAEEDIEEALCAVIFNAKAYLKHILEERNYDAPKDKAAGARVSD